MESIFAQIAADVKGALAGGVVACILDRGTLIRKLFNGIGSVVISITFTRGVLDLTGSFIPKTDNVTMLFAAVFAIVGIVMAEILQRVARRVLGRTDALTDKVVDKYTGTRHDEHST